MKGVRRIAAWSARRRVTAFGPLKPAGTACTPHQSSPFWRPGEASRGAHAHSEHLRPAGTAFDRAAMAGRAGFCSVASLYVPLRPAGARRTRADYWLRWPVSARDLCPISQPLPPRRVASSYLYAPRRFDAPLRSVTGRCPGIWALASASGTRRLPGRMLSHPAAPILGVGRLQQHLHRAAAAARRNWLRKPQPPGAAAPATLWLPPRVPNKSNCLPCMGATCTHAVGRTRGVDLVWSQQDRRSLADEQAAATS